MKHWINKLADGDTDFGKTVDLKDALSLPNTMKTTPYGEHTIGDVDSFSPISTGVKTNAECQAYQKELMTKLKTAGVKYICVNKMSEVDVSDFEQYGQHEHTVLVSSNEKDWYYGLSVHEHTPKYKESIDHDSHNMGTEEEAAYDEYVNKGLPCTEVMMAGDTSTYKEFR